MGSITLKGQNEILMLATSTFKKLFMESFEQQNISYGLNCFASVCNELLSENLYEDIIPLFNSTSAMVRRKAVVSTYKIIL